MKTRYFLLAAACLLGAPAARADETGGRKAIGASRPEGVRFGEFVKGRGTGEPAQVSGKISKVSGSDLWLGARRFLVDGRTPITGSDGRRLSRKALAPGASVMISAAPMRGGRMAAEQVVVMIDEDDEKPGPK